MIGRSINGLVIHIHPHQRGNLINRWPGASGGKENELISGGFIMGKRGVF